MRLDHKHPQVPLPSPPRTLQSLPSTPRKALNLPLSPFTSSPFLVNKPLSLVCTACWNVDWPCWLAVVQVTMAAVSLWVQWLCHVPNIALPGTPHPLVLTFLLPSF